jgi:hypothetical protein
MKKYILLACALFSMHVIAQTQVLKSDKWQCDISSSGFIDNLSFQVGGKVQTIPFFKGRMNPGPCFYVVSGSNQQKGQWTSAGNLSFKAIIGAVECRIHYMKWNGQPAIKVVMTNKGNTTFAPTKAGLKIGVDTYMDKYPEWSSKYFPTLMRNEKHHFFGYMQSPKGGILGIVSPQPIASWSVDYNFGYKDSDGHVFMGHRIESLNLDLLNTLPLPKHHPQNMSSLRSGESKSWIIVFFPVSHLASFEQQAHQIARIPMIRMQQTSFVSGEKVSFDVLGIHPTVAIENDKGGMLKCDISKVSGELYRVKCMLPQIGLYDVTVNDNGFVSEGVLTAHASWKWTLERARAAAEKYRQKATSHGESWYGYYSAFIAKRYFPDPQLDASLDKRFDYLFRLLHDQTKMEPLYYRYRIQNTSTTIGLLVQRYQAKGDIIDLKRASQLADWLIRNWQRPDGAYINGKVVYTSVIYVAKSILELALEEQEISKTDSSWKVKAQQHYESVRRAIDQLVSAKGNFDTEGEMTFEDGMVSCSALQIGMFALTQQDPIKRKHYTDAMLEILKSHDCLAQLRVPDARRRGGTMRYWEAQYDVQMLPNMFISPHGWSAWRCYATYYAYLLTGDEHWLNETNNALGAFCNLVDYRNGDLRWAFVVDPYIEARQACSADPRYTADSLSFGNPHPDVYKTKQFVVGEQYINMISDWQTVNTQDNDVHEVFKCIGEAMLTSAYVVERTDGTIKTYNCTARKENGKLLINSNEKQIVHLHCNLKKGYTIIFNNTKSFTVNSNYLGWVTGDPYLL